KYLTGLPDFGAPIRIRHLLHHSSGLRDWSPGLVLAGESWTDITSDKIMAFAKHQRELESLPGERDLYCNTGYNLLFWGRQLGCGDGGGSLRIGAIKLPR